ncbi:hypothetical protein HHK36_030305 [Tetracentron sinense]|uniref:Alcohol dehydrogenase-like C-terminal domain-containing protein n=1 Tax=Tetracentron sinense TaxID=13715 RepID=A0A834Y9N4_TETSI|nr:hypothetical protein HHK36_030305 [Tetracentron sinense]
MDEDHKMNCIAKQVSKPWYRSYRVKVKRLEGGLILFVLPSWEESSYILKGGLGAAWKIADISEGSNVVIFGLGTVGLSVAQGAKLRGASRIIGVDVNPEKYEKGKAFGITEFINPNDCNEPVHQVIKRITDGGADYSFECIGDTGMVTTALQSCCDGWGLTITLGVPKVKPEITAHFGLLLSGRTLRGSLFGGWKPKSDLPLLVDMYLRKLMSFYEETSYFSDEGQSFDVDLLSRSLVSPIPVPILVVVDAHELSRLLPKKPLQVYIRRKNTSNAVLLAEQTST